MRHFLERRDDLDAGARQNSPYDSNAGCAPRWPAPPTGSTGEPFLEALVERSPPAPERRRVQDARAPGNEYTFTPVGRRAADGVNTTERRAAGGIREGVRAARRLLAALRRTDPRRDPAGDHRCDPPGRAEGRRRKYSVTPRRPRLLHLVRRLRARSDAGDDRAGDPCDQLRRLGSIGYGRAFIRWIAGYLSAIVFFLGFFWMLWDKEKQCWHDKLASDVVVPVSAYPLNK